MARPVNPLSLELKKDMEEEAQDIAEAVKVVAVENNMADPFPIDEFYKKEMQQIETVNPLTGQIMYSMEEKLVYSPNNPNYQNKHLIKCRVRAAKAFDVTIDHLTEAYRVLNGKKVDNVMVPDLIDRFGWSNGIQMNRSQLAEKYKVSVYSIELAQEKLKSIIQRKDINTAYMEYVRAFEQEHAVDFIRNQTGI